MYIHSSEVFSQEALFILLKLSAILYMAYVIPAFSTICLLSIHQGFEVQYINLIAHNVL